MTELQAWLSEWMTGLRATAQRHGVHPLGFALIYLASWPPYLASWGWLATRAKRRQPLSPALLALAAFFLGPYAYLLLFGRDLPLWIYVAVGILLLFGGWQLGRRIRRLQREQSPEIYAADSPPEHASAVTGPRESALEQDATRHHEEP